MTYPTSVVISMGHYLGAATSVAHGGAGQLRLGPDIIDLHPDELISWASGKADTFLLWQWTAITGRLRELSTVLAESESQRWQSGYPEPPEPAAMLSDILTSLHVLLSQYGGYLDEL